MTKEELNVACKNVTSFACGVCPIEVRHMHMKLEDKVIERFIRHLPTPGMYVKKFSTFNHMRYEYDEDYELFVETKEGMITLWSLPVNRQIEIMKKACMED